MPKEVPALFECSGVGFRYQLGSVFVTGLEDVSLKISEGSLTALAGPSGSGKSTLLFLLGLIESVQKGSLRFNSKDLKKLTEVEKNEIRRFELGFVFQNFLLFDTLSAFENVEYFLHRKNLSKAQRKKKVDAVLEAVGLASHKAKRPLEMSGGQRQRVAIARALVKEPKVILADEPTASLDQATGKQIMDLFSYFVKKEKGTVILASHDPMALTYADTLVRLRDGQISKVEKQ